MVGLPGAGKTTRARELEASLPALRLSPDEWITAVLGPSPARDELDAARDPVERALWQLARRTLELGVDVILDFGFWSRAEREDYRARAAALGAGSVVHFVDAAPEVLAARLAARARARSKDTFDVSAADLAQWSASFERPDAEELTGR